MRAFRKESGTAAALVRANIDTDQIIPKQFLKRIERTGYGPYLFYDWRYREDGTENPDFVLNRDPANTAAVLVAGRNFGCGSSREHAVWALNDFGFRAVIAPGYADIFKSNASKMGLLTVELPEEQVELIASRVEENPATTIEVDLEAQLVRVEEMSFRFEVEPFTRHCLLEGLDDIGLTLGHEVAITEFESRRPTWMPDTRRLPAEA